MGKIETFSRALSKEQSHNEYLFTFELKHLKIILDDLMGQ